MTLFVERLAGWVAPADAFTAFYGGLENSFWLDREHNPSEPYSVIGTGQLASPSQLQDALAVTAADSRRKSSSAQALPFSFRPGLVGVLDYDSAALRQCGDLSPIPELSQLSAPGRFLSVDRAIVFDHRQRSIYFLAELAEEADFREWHHAALLRLALIGGNAKLWLHQNQPAIAEHARLRIDKDGYQSAIERIKEAISRGDAYQVCLTNRIQGPFSGDPLSYYLSIRPKNPAPYGGFLKIGTFALASISPELLLSSDGDIVRSAPIKGTRPRMAGREDELQVQQLQADPKERAENLMIVDLLRNDLQIVCEPNSVTVAQLLKVKSYATVHQLESEVRGSLRPNTRTGQLIEACFPAGSMTGAPKIAAMKIIHALEGVERGVYAGGFGFISNHGNLELGMVIRAVVFEADQFEIGVGGGLTIDSTPEREFEETLLKARALLAPWKVSPSW